MSGNEWYQNPLEILQLILMYITLTQTNVTIDIRHTLFTVNMFTPGKMSQTNFFHEIAKSWQSLLDHNLSVVFLI